MLLRNQRLRIHLIGLIIISVTRSYEPKRYWPDAPSLGIRPLARRCFLCGAIHKRKLVADVAFPVSATTADITVSSSDGVLFKVHRKNLEVHSAVFASAETTTLPENGAETVQLSGTSDVLDLLFQFMYPQPQPDLRALGFDVFAPLAETAEKYMVFSALTLCHMKSKKSMPLHPLEVLEYAVKHGHSDLADGAARRSMGRSVSDAMRILAPDTFKTWVRHASILCEPIDSLKHADNSPGALAQKDERWPDSHAGIEQQQHSNCEKVPGGSESMVQFPRRSGASGRS
ncbi:hypothetical protein DFH09DRAFT_931676 [Mycena vulgaris]|nr:hypothetical protein DFH09DRAFT_931676 [Mycena vulgaris]